VTDDDGAREVQAALEAALAAESERQGRLARAARAVQVERDARTAVDRAREQLVSEAADVQRLESYSTTRIWAALRGSRDADLDRELAEQQAAEYAVARAESWLRVAREEAQRATGELAALGDVAAQRRRALAAKEAWLTTADPEVGRELSRLADEIARTRATLAEVLEAAVAAERAAVRLDAALRMLGSAGDWATYDTFLGGGMLGDAVKYDRMDKAQRLLHDADQALRHLAVELQDVGASAVERLAVDGLTQTFDVWFDNIFSDWSVRSRIADATRKAARTADAVQEIRTRLARQERDLSEREASCVARREDLLLASPT
jgi:hypothetical protein